MFKRKLILVSLLALCSCNRKGHEPATGEVSALTPVQLAASYQPRIGIAVRTESRTCVVIKNGNLAASSPMVLVIPAVPQFFSQARITARSEEPCPIAKDSNSALTSYELIVPDGYNRIPKLQPMIAVVGDARPFLLTNITVQADLDRTRESRMFHACSSGDGAHLTVWSGTPLNSSLLWHGFYYDPNTSRRAAACTPAEQSGL